jgi:predicted lipid carrier protein YhbT
VKDATAEFFEGLAARGGEPALAKSTGSIRFDLVVRNRRTTHWHVAIRRGAVDVSRRKARADCVVRTDRALFEEIVSGRANALTAVLRGAMSIEGDATLLLPLQRLFQGPAEAGS